MLGIFSDEEWPPRRYERRVESWLRFISRLVFCAVIVPAVGLVGVAMLILAVSWKLAFAAGIATILLCMLILVTLVGVARFLIGITPPPI
jgi:hypothetical protein